MVARRRDWRPALPGSSLLRLYSGRWEGGVSLGPPLAANPFRLAALATHPLDRGGQGRYALNLPPGKSFRTQGRILVHAASHSSARKYRSTGRSPFCACGTTFPLKKDTMSAVQCATFSAGDSDADRLSFIVYHLSSIRCLLSSYTPSRAIIWQLEGACLLYLTSFI